MASAATRLAVGQRRCGQLPAEVTSFVGRRTELARLSSLLGTARLVTVTGPGGVGKTRVALRAATRAADRYSDGVCFIELSGLTDPALLAGAVADCLGLREQDGLAGVLSHLRDRQWLLVLDTCEHIVDGCATFAEALLREAPGVTLLATSRQPLDVPGEHLLSVPPLPVPGPDESGSGHDDAVELFAQRATAAVPSFRLTDETRADVARLCRRLDGIPLAIELAAVRLRALPLPELAGRLAEHRFQVLDGGRRGAVPRHQTLRTAIGWSYDLCTREEQRLWARLSVFAGTFDVAAAEHVCATPGSPDSPGSPATPGGHPELIEPLIGLVEKSVVLRDGTAGDRYRLPDTLREFGMLRLAADGERDACRERHLSYYLGAARRFRDGFSGGGQLRRLRELRACHDDLRTALARGLEDGTAAELATALQAYWVISGRLEEGRYWLGRVTERFPEPSPERAAALVSRAYLGAFQGETDAATSDAREGIRIAEGLGAEDLEARGYLYLHTALAFGGRHDHATEAWAEAERRLTALRDDAGLILLAVERAHLSQLANHPEAAIRQCERTLRHLRDGRTARAPGDGERWLCGYLYTIAALAYLQMPGREERCAASAVKGLRATYELGDVPGTAYALEVLAWLAAARGRPARAAWLTGAADPLWERAGKRLSGAAVMLGAHQRAVRTALDGLGEERFTALRAHGAACALDEVVAAAMADADEVSTAGPAPRTGEPAAGQQASGREAAGPASETGQGGLTCRERQIAALVANGLSNREIATQLVISKRTVDAHVEHIFGKLGISSRVQLTIWVRQHLDR